MKFYNAVFLLALLPSTVLGQAPGGLYAACPNGNSDCRSGLVCFTVRDPVCLHGVKNTPQYCPTGGSDCASGFCTPGISECAPCSSVSDCNGSGGIGGAIGCDGVCLVGSEFIPII